MIAKDYLALNY